MGSPRTRRVRQSGIRVLVVEDDADVLNLLALMVSEHGATVEKASNGEDALAMMADDPPHLVLCDVRMPLMDGYALMQQVARDPRLRRIPVVAITGLTRRQDLMKTWEAGFAGYLIKPVSSQAIEAQLERVLRAHSGRGAPSGPGSSGGRGRSR